MAMIQDAPERGVSIAQLRAQLERKRPEWERIVTKAKYGPDDGRLTSDELLFIRSYGALSALLMRREDAEREGGTP